MLPPGLRCQRCASDHGKVGTRLRSSHGFKGLGSASRGGWGWSPSLRGFVGNSPIPVGCPLGHVLEHPPPQAEAQTRLRGHGSLAVGVATQIAKMLWIHADA